MGTSQHALEIEVRNEKPILFSEPMVRAILAGVKTQTRRLVKPRHGGKILGIGGPGIAMESLGVVDGIEHIQTVPCPYGKIGDQLWVREKWRIGSWWDDDRSFWIDYCDGPRKERLECPDPYTASRFIAQTGAELARKNIEPTNGSLYEWEPGESPLRWRPSIHMPRWASRINLAIEDVRMERLQSLSEADAIAEGVFRKVGDTPIGDAVETATGGELIYVNPGQARAEYQRLWNQINTETPWSTNPWVWVIEFKRSKNVQ